MKLYIAEKPSVARAIAQAIGTLDTKQKGQIVCENDTVVTWCFGHMYHLAEPDDYTGKDVPVSSKTGKKLWRWEELPILPVEWKYKATDSCKEQLHVIKDLLKKAETVVNAGDPDREGQLLVDEVLEEAKYKGEVLRYWANAVDDKSVKKAIADLKPNVNYKGLADSARARGRADWLVGMNLSRAFTLANRSLITVGRVQTPTLKLVYDRDQKIRNFKPIDYFLLTATFETNGNGGSYKGRYIPDESQVGFDEEGRLIDKNVAATILSGVKNHEGVIEQLKSENKKANQPLGLNLADLTALASAKLGFSAKEVLELAQSLYENKYTSYPRTDSQYLPLSQFDDGQSVLENIELVYPSLSEAAKKADTTIKSRIWNDEKTTAHHAIIPVAGSTTMIQGDEAKLYDLIARCYIAQFYPAHEYTASELITAVENHKFMTKAKTIVKNGWRDVYSTEEESEETEASLPTVAQGDKVICTESEATPKKTKAPAKFTEGTLIKAMENVFKFVDDDEFKKELEDGDGIGTSATRAGIIEELKKRNYIQASGKYIESTDKAAQLLSIVPEVVQSAIMTAKQERELKAIAENGASFNDLISKCCNFICSEVENARAQNVAPTYVKETTDVKCPLCGKTLLSSKFYFECSCGFKANKEILGASITEDALKEVIAGKSPEFSFKSVKTGKTFKAKLAVDTDKKSLKFEMNTNKKTNVEVSEKFKCPKCGKGLIRRESTKTKGAFWWGCSGYPTCKEMFIDSKGEPNFTGNKK